MAKSTRAERIDDFEILDLMPGINTTENCEEVRSDSYSESDFDLISTSDHDNLDSDTDSVWDPESESYSIVKIPSTLKAPCKSSKREAQGKSIETINGDCTNKSFPSQKGSNHLCHQKYCPLFSSGLSGDPNRIDEHFSVEWRQWSNKSKNAESKTLNQYYSLNKICLTLQKSDKSEEYSLCKECKAVKCTLCDSVSYMIDRPLNNTLQNFLGLTEPVEWKLCFNCQSEIKLKYPLGSDFCHNCATHQISINNPDWNFKYDKVLGSTRGEDRDPGPFLKETQVQAEEVIDNWYGMSQPDTCYHGEWRWLKGHHQCQRCFQHQSQYIFQCSTCYFQVCYRCRRKKF